MVLDVDIDDEPMPCAAPPNPAAAPHRPSKRHGWSSGSQGPLPATSSTTSGDQDIDEDDSFSDNSGRWTNSAPGGSASGSGSGHAALGFHPVGSANDFRDSLIDTAEKAPQQQPQQQQHPRRNPARASEYGSDVMRMDDGYRCTSIIQKRSAQPANGLTPLLQAAKDGDVVLLNSLIIQPGTDILRRDPVYGQTALHFAIRGGHLAIVQALLMPELAGSIVNIPDSRRNTALHLAAAKSRRMTKLLLDAGADVNFLNMRNQTPLGVHILTTTRDDPTMTEILLQGRANPNAPVDTSTLLHVALDKKLYQIAQRLVRHGARLDLKDQTGRMVFDKVDARTLKMLLSKATVAPVWVPDNDRINCMGCEKSFGASTRRHHCRYCGRLLCAKCTAHHLRQAQLPFSSSSSHRRHKKQPRDGKKQRVCESCYEIIMEGDVNSTSTASMSNPANLAASV